MPKFSIIVPVYNVEKYIKKCLNSILKQSYKDFEIIVVNDGTTDNSIEIIKDYPVKIINQKNSGLSGARNMGVKEATGEYIIFLDSDDYIDVDLLKNINDSLANNPEVIRFQLRMIYENGQVLEYLEESFTNKTGVDAFSIISQYHIVESACCYAIKRDYYLKENFNFKLNTYHEDFGLVPLIIIKANCVNSIGYIGYNYFQRTGSIMNNDIYSKTYKKVNDVYNHYQFLKDEVDKASINAPIFKSFIANSLIIKICELNRSDYKKMKKIIKHVGVYDDILTDTVVRKIKKILLIINPKLYCHIKR